MMPDREKVIAEIKDALYGDLAKAGYVYKLSLNGLNDKALTDALVLLKEHKNEYENGFNDAMLGKQELMYEGTDGKWHKKDW